MARLPAFPGRGPTEWQSLGRVRRFTSKARPVGHGASDEPPDPSTTLCRKVWSIFHTTDNRVADIGRGFNWLP